MERKKGVWFWFFPCGNRNSQYILVLISFFRFQFFFRYFVECVHFQFDFIAIVIVNVDNWQNWHTRIYHTRIAVRSKHTNIDYYCFWRANASVASKAIGNRDNGYKPKSNVIFQYWIKDNKKSLLHCVKRPIAPNSAHYNPFRVVYTTTKANIT